MSMTGSVAGDSRGAQSDDPKATGKSAEEKTEQQSSSAPSSPPKENTSFLPPLETLTLKTTDSSSPSDDLQTRTVPRKPRVFNRCTSSLPAVAKGMDVGASSLARSGRAQSVLTLYNKPSAALDEDGSCGAMSELGAPASSRRRRQQHEVRAYGTLERATSYGSLTARPHFRSANSTRPRPAPPCTTTHLDFGRHHHHHHSGTNPVAGSRLGTPRRNNPHPVGLHFQSPYNRDGKTFEVWSPDESVTNRLPQMCKHIDQTNFTCGKTQLYPSRGVHSDLHPGNGGSVYRASYRTPQGHRDHDRCLPTTRFGSTFNRAAAIGVVPNVMSPHCAAERRVRLHVPRGQKLESLV